MANLIDLFDDILGWRGQQDIATVLGDDILSAAVLHLDESGQRPIAKQRFTRLTVI
jgi:hypothetical protein